MSGGAFDYNCFRISQFAEELKNKIEENDNEINGYAPYYNQKTIEYLIECQKIIELSGKLAYDIEWLYSGDIGEETFQKRYKENMK
jgi:hypothetical protein